MTQEWNNLLSGLQFIKPEAANKEKIIQTLDYSRDYDITVIDILKHLNILTNEEYIYYLNKLKELQEDSLKFIQITINEANKHENYDPMLHYFNALPILLRINQMETPSK